MTTFQRAHSPQQREVRRNAILAAATAMLDEMPASAISLNELSRRAGMAKSNVLRYFESREAVLLELCNAHMTAWIGDLDKALEAAVDAGATANARARALVDTLTTSLAERPVLCDLMASQAAVLDHNVSTTAVLQFKRVSIANFDRLIALMGRHMPELGSDRARRFTMLAAMLASSVWTNSRPPTAVVAAYEADPQIACYRIEFEPALRDALRITMAGLLAEE